MTGEASKTGDVRGFATAVHSRLVADSRIAGAMAFTWLCAAISIALCLAAAGLVIAFSGYAQLFSKTTGAELTARAFARAIEGVRMKATISGTMSFAPNAELRLAEGQTVGLSKDAVVKLDPESAVHIIGNLRIDAPQPSNRQLQLGALSKSDEVPFTNYTIFRDVSYDKGHVVTGWDYDLTDTTRPKSQFCYYSQNIEKGITAKYIIAVNDAPRRPSALAKLSFDFDGALSNCIWFSGY